MKVAKSNYFFSSFCFHFLFTIILLALNPVLSIRFPDRIPEVPQDASNQPLQTAVFSLGSFWRSEASFGCLNGIVRTTVGYSGGSKANPEYRNLGDHAESVQVEYDPQVLGFRQLLEVFWASHDSRQVFGQGPDVGNQYRSIIFTSGTEESRLAAVSKEREQSKSKSSVVITQIQQLEAFYPAEPEHQKERVESKALKNVLDDFTEFMSNQMLSKFELKRNPFLLQLMGNLPEEELERSTLATKLNGYAAELCSSRIQKRIDAKINDIIKKGWPILKEV
uniref:Peptide methionine sulfoxide reductase A5 n=1 Tax=Solanum tuberosum TaxID=4113 RepID=M0ZW30_SOLTU